MNVEFPQVFVASHYSFTYGELAGLSEQGLREHYFKIGLHEGRVASPMALREVFVTAPQKCQRALEIGPFCNPVLSGPGVKYLDVLDAEELRVRAVEMGVNPKYCPQTIDFVGGIESVSGIYEAVFSSHAIEHQPDLVAHLNGIEKLLEPGGVYFLIAPDKRYCFDHHRPESTIGDVMEAHKDRRQYHSMSAVIDHWTLTAHNDPVRHWAEDHGNLTVESQVAGLKNSLDLLKSNDGRYLDTHAWQFTPKNFESITQVLFHAGLTKLRPIRVYHTPRNRFEFCAILST